MKPTSKLWCGTFWVGTFGLLLVAMGCDSESARKDGDDAALPCALGGTFLVGTPRIVDGACPGGIPAARMLTVFPQAGNDTFAVDYAGVTVSGRASGTCELAGGPSSVVLDGHAALVSVRASVEGDQLSALVELAVSDRAPDELCDVRYELTGQRVDPTQLGNPTGGSCGTGASCVGDRCAYGEVSACQFDTCVFQRLAGTGTGADERVYCSEPCSPGSCPEGYACADFGDFAYRTLQRFFCALAESTCGDGLREGSEACDDGNREGGDDCSADCRSTEQCGNGLVDGVRFEQCDDGNLVDGDGCSARCALEVCGNGTIDPDEVCDDGNLASGDGCGGTCRFEQCGNGLLDVGEACDDGNATSTDGCEGTCRRLPLAGFVPFDAGWVRTQPGGDTALMQGAAVAVDGDRFVTAWTEHYEAPLPFGAATEIYTSSAPTTGGSWHPARRQASLAGQRLWGLARLSSGLVVALVGQGMSLSLARSTDGGATFGAATPLALQGLPLAVADDFFASLHGDGERLYVFVGLHVLVADHNRSLYFARSIDGGTSFTAAVRLSPDPSFRNWASAPQIAALASGELVIVWADGASSGGDVLAARSRDGGESWLRRSERLGGHAAARTDRAKHALVLEGSQAHVAWADVDGVRAARWARNGTAWQSQLVQSSASLGGPVSALALGQGSGADVHLAVAVDGATRVRRSTDDGASFGATHTLGEPVSVDVLEVAGLAWVVQRASASGATDVLRLVGSVARDTAGTRSVGIVVGLSDDGGASWAPHLAALPASASFDERAGMGPWQVASDGPHGVVVAPAPRLAWGVLPLEVPLAAGN